MSADPKAFGKTASGSSEHAARNSDQISGVALADGSAMRPQQLLGERLVELA